MTLSWELPSIPTEYSSIFSRFELLLAPSHLHGFTILDSSQCNVLNHYVDLPDKFPPNSPLVDPSCFNFLFSADCNSFIDRKNPHALLRAFRSFMLLAGNSNIRPRLILRLTNLSPSLHSEFIQSFHNDADIQLIDQPLAYSDYISLMNSVQCYVSPHRCEGFGRNIAEAMQLGTPVISSNYSGNLDFCNFTNSLLINGSLIDVPISSYPHASGMKWFDPSHQHLTQLLYDVFSNYDEALNRANLAQTSSLADLSLAKYEQNLFSYLSDYVC